jgi:hypothetical protein
MINKLTKFAIAILVTSATVTATRAPAATISTNTQVLDNISVLLTVYSQGGVNSSDKSLAVDKTTIKTPEIIYQLGQIGGFAVDAKKDKLVLSTTYTNILVGQPNTTEVISTVTLNNDAGIIASGGSMFFWTDDVGDYIGLDLVDSTSTNSYTITNGFNDFSQNAGEIWLTYNGVTTYPVGNSFYAPIDSTTNALYTSTSGSPFDTSTNFINYSALPASSIDGFGNILYPAGTFQSGSSGALGYWVTVVPTVTPTATNVTITQYGPVTNELFALNQQHICVMTPKSGTTAPTLTKVDNWVAWDLNAGGTTFYAESGKDLSTNDFSGTNITGETTYGTGDLLVYTTYPTTGAAPTVTNLSLDPAGFSKGTAKLMNLTLHGKATNAQVFQIISSSTVTAAGEGYIGGFFTTNYQYISSISIGGVTNYTQNTPIESQINDNATGNYLGTNFVVNTNSPGDQYVQNPTQVAYEGTVTLTFLSSGPEILPVDP